MGGRSGGRHRKRKRENQTDKTCCADPRECREATGKVLLAQGEELRSRTEAQTQMETASPGLNVELSPPHTSRHKGCPLRWVLKEGKGVWARTPKPEIEGIAKWAALI